jgi:hypothetical protein
MMAENRGPGAASSTKKRRFPERETAFSIAMRKIKFVTGKKELL